MLDKAKAIKTTILGIATIVLSGLVLFGVVTPEQSTEVSGGTISILDALIAIIVAASGVINIFRAD